MSTHLTLKIICSRNTVKDLFYFTDFSSNVLLFDARKNICTGPFLDIQELHSYIPLNANVCIFLYILLTKCFFQRRDFITWSEGWERQNNFFRDAPRNLTTSIYSIKMMKYPRQGFNCKTVAKFHIRNHFLK